MHCTYILHFDSPLAHAQHYSGSTNNIIKRLQRHATGTGSRLTQVLKELGKEWQVAIIYVGTTWETERKLKKQHNGRDYCPICNTRPRTLSGSTSIDLSLLDIPLTSELIRRSRYGIRGQGQVDLESGSGRREDTTS